jgi:hypothetical protein
MKIFSFCIYGTDTMYYDGLFENIGIINKFFPDFNIHIYVGNEHIEDYIKKYQEYRNCTIFNTNLDGAINMIFRYKSLLLPNIEIFFSRDADSRINERDRWTINKFIESSYTTHTIRDHFWHKSFLTGGLTGFKNPNNNIINKFQDIFDNISNHNNNNKYGGDENILNDNIYSLVKADILIHTNICAYKNEKYCNIDFINDNTNFCGNVINNNQPRFKYADFDIINQLEWLSKQEQYNLILIVIDECFILYDNLPYSIISNILEYKFIAYYNLNDLKGCINNFAQFYKYEITDSIKYNNRKFLYDLIINNGYKIIATTDVLYEPLDGEFVVYYGNFPDDCYSLIQSNKIYRNVYLLLDKIEGSSNLIDLIRKDVPFFEFKSDPSWNSVDKIYIIGLEGQIIRMNDTILQLCLMNAPLDRVFIYFGKKAINRDDIYAYATWNHIECMQMMIDKKEKNCLLLEDDFIFCSDYHNNLIRIKEFFTRSYDYDICFLSASKYRERIDYDDLLILSKQICTTSSGYFLSGNNIELVHSIVNEGYQILLNGGNANIYCIDQYWRNLNHRNKMFIFKRKLGFQKISISNITGKVNSSLD